MEVPRLPGAERDAASAEEGGSCVGGRGEEEDPPGGPGGDGGIDVAAIACFALLVGIKAWCGSGVGVSVVVAARRGNLPEGPLGGGKGEDATPFPPTVTAGVLPASSSSVRGVRGET